MSSSLYEEAVPDALSDEISLNDYTQQVSSSMNNTSGTQRICKGAAGEWFPNKRYLRMLSCTKWNPLSHHQRMVYSYLAYKVRDDNKPVLRSDIEHALGLDRRTITSATSALARVGLCTKVGRGHVALAPGEESSSWFSRPHEGKNWWECFRTYPLYILTEAARSSRGNPVGQVTEMDNAVMWLLFSLAKGAEIVRQSNEGLRAILGCSINTVKGAINQLADKGLVMIRSDGYTLLQPDATRLGWWQDRRKRGQAREAEPAKARAPVKTAPLDVGDLIHSAMPTLPANETEYVVLVVQQMSGDLKAGRFTDAQVEQYLSQVLPMFKSAEDVILFKSGTWKGLWGSASAVHGEKGYARNCYHLLLENTRTELS